MGVNRSERKNNTKELRIHLVTIVGEEPCTNLMLHQTAHLKIAKNTNNQKRIPEVKTAHHHN